MPVNKQSEPETKIKWGGWNSFGGWGGMRPGPSYDRCRIGQAAIEAVVLRGWGVAMPCLEMGGGVSKHG
eukprot:667336-Hanusia_phi.AAC.1